MVKPGALLLLLAVAASQVDLSMAQSTDISACPINFFGRTTLWADVVFNADSTFSICFMETETEDPTECLLFSEAEGATSATISPDTTATETGSPLHTDLPDITVASPCFVSIVMMVPDGISYNIKVYPFDDDVAVEVSPEFAPDDYVIQARLGEEVVREMATMTAATFYLDISACRQYDYPVFRSSSHVFEETCETASCDIALTLSDESTCVGYEVCQGSNTCIVPTIVCTVTGSTVIDFNNNTQTITNRCGYDLAHPTDGGDHLEVVFRERRRKDVLFVDELILYVEETATYIYMRQGGIVEVEGDDVLTLSDMPTTFHGADFFKDDYNVIHAIMPDTGMEVSFDGNTIHVSGPFQPSSYLCGDPTNPSTVTTPEAQKDLFYDPEHCDTDYTDDTDAMIDMSDVTTACAALRSAPFDACNDFIDPGPYITACMTTMSAYPNVDGLLCQFYEAYAVSCYLRNDIVLAGWQAATECAVVLQHSCREQSCSSHEFCGEMLGHTRCLCRALFADTYVSTNNNLGDPIVCEENTATISLAACLLWGDGIDPLSLHLNDPTCTGDLDDDNMITFSFGSSTCDTILTTQETDLVFHNTIMTSASGDITRDDYVAINLYCHYLQPDSRTVNFFITDGSVTIEIDSGEWSYTLNIGAFYDPGRYHFIEPGAPLSVDQRIWLGMTADGLNDRVDVLIDACWATYEDLDTDVLQHDLIVDGCPVDPTVIMERNGLGHSVYFSVSMFVFYNDDSNVYLHCQVELCPSDPGCTPDCSGVGRRKRRSPSSATKSLITMTWKK